MSFLCCCCRKSSEAPAFELGVLDYPLVRLDRNGGDVSVESSATGDALGDSSGMSLAVDRGDLVGIARGGLLGAGSGIGVSSQCSPAIGGGHRHS